MELKKRSLPKDEPSEKKLQRMQNKMNKIKAFIQLTRHPEANETATDTDLQPSNKRIETSAADATPKPHRRDIPSDELEHLRARLRAQQKEKLSRPLIFQTHVPDAVTPADIRQLIMYALEGGNTSGLKPTWCTLVRWMKVSQIVVVTVENMTRKDFDTYSEDSPYVKSFLDTWSPMEPQEPGLLARNLLEYPLSARGFERFSGSLVSQMVASGDLRPEYKEYNGLLQNLRVLGDPAGTVEFCRLHLLMSIERMALERYPVPSFSRDLDIGHYVATKDVYEPVLMKSPLFAVDCEMCMTTSKKSELTRISIVNENLQVVYDTYVKPYNPITNYLTKYSGITKAILDPVKTRLHDVQQAIRKLLPPDAILCGQSLNGDLVALEMIHPYVIDTSVIYNLKGNPRAKSSLKVLSKMFLSKDIQESEKKGHDSVEDSRTTMELVLLKLRNGYSFGDVTRGWRFSASESAALSEIIQNDEQPEPPAAADPPPALQLPLKRKTMESVPEFTADTPSTSCVYLQSLLTCAERGKKAALVAGSGSYIDGESAKGRDVHYLASSKAVLKFITEKLPEYQFVFGDVRLKKKGDSDKQKAHMDSLMRKITRIFSSAADRALCLLVGGGDMTEHSNLLGLCRAGIKGLDTFLVEPETAESVSDPD